MWALVRFERNCVPLTYSFVSDNLTVSGHRFSKLVPGIYDNSLSIFGKYAYVKVCTITWLFGLFDV